MSQAGERLLRSAEQALAYAEGRAEPGSFRVHTRVAGLSIRDEQPSDIQRIHAIESAAFGKKAIADIVDQLRDDGELWLSHVALLDDAIVGHCAYSLVTVTDGDTVRRFPALGPIGVEPACQGRGIGGALVRSGIEAARAAGQGLLFLVGSPGYYPRFGFEPALPLGFTSDYVTDSQRHEHFMAYVIDAALIGQVRGHVRWHDCFAGH